METVLKTLNSRIGRKSISIDADKTKQSNLKHQMKIYESSMTKLDESIEVKQGELDEMVTLKIEAEDLIKKRKALQAYTDGLREKFDAIEWRPDLTWEEKIESTDYAAKVAERQSINERLVEIEKTANKIYYRR